MANRKYIDRPPRIEPQLPSGVFNIPNPPDTEVKFGELLQQAFLPMIMILGYVLASLFGQGRNMLMMIPMMLSVIATVILAIYTNTQERKKREAAEAAYKRRISELRRKMESEHEQQRIYYFTIIPTPKRPSELPRTLIVMSRYARRRFVPVRVCGSAAPRTTISCTCAWASVHGNQPWFTKFQKTKRRKARSCVKRPAWLKIPVCSMTYR